ncbi:MAG: NADH-quinone oxidoreductase subunit C [SAR324 cluster bacterium]|nr:NADH-quinone oxidoreductase subunit C [SAR324 cluster bacterium]
MDQEILLAQIRQIDPQNQISPKKADRIALEITATSLHEVMRTMRQQPDLGFDMLCSHTAVDWLENGFELIYVLYSTQFRQSLMIIVNIPRENPVIPTVSDIWLTAEAQEREVFDLFGVQYDHHPDLRRLFLEDDWVGYPMRKDYKDDFMLESTE